MAIQAMMHHGLTKGQRKEWRRKGYATANLYGNGIGSLQLLVPVREVMDRIIQQGGRRKAILQLRVAEGSERVYRARVQEIQRHLTAHDPIHFDLHVSG